MSSCVRESLLAVYAPPEQAPDTTPPMLVSTECLEAVHAILESGRVQAILIGRGSRQYC